MCGIYNVRLQKWDDQNLKSCTSQSALKILLFLGDSRYQGRIFLLHCHATYEPFRKPSSSKIWTGHKLLIPTLQVNQWWHGLVAVEERVEG